MMTDAEKAQVIARERHDVYAEATGLRRSMHQAILLFVTLAGVLVGVYWDTSVVPKAEDRHIIMFGLTQVEYFLALFVMSLMVKERAFAPYLAALERKLNALADDTIAAWHSELSEQFVYRKTASFMWAVLFMVGLVAAVFFGCIFAALETINSLLFGIILGVGLFTLLAITARYIAEQKEIGDRASSLLE